MAEDKHRAGGLIDTFLLVEQKLKRYLMKLIVNRQDVEDIVQETILRAYQAEKNTEIRAPKSFLFRIAHNLAISEIKRRRRRVQIDIGEIDEQDVLGIEQAPEDRLERDRLQKVLLGVIQELPPRCRTVFVLRKVYGLSHREIAERMGISQKTVENHLTKALHHCQIALFSEQDGKRRLLQEKQ
ncbi:MAG TPA: RNA polymerase sigma factor [Hyphomicrobiales bacterium]|nr:RNA polymerase sigma factor [Hyphomicrobiales bacterium]